MKKRFLQVCLLLGLLGGLGATASGEVSVNALTDAVREAETQTLDKYEKSYFYGNSAVRSINNLVGTTYNFTDSEFNKAVGSYQDKLVSKANYDDTDKVFKKPPSDNLAVLNTLLKVPSQKAHWLTNYSKEELKSLGLSSVSSDDADSDLQENIIDNSDTTTSNLISYLSYLINSDYYTIPYNVSVSKTRGLVSSIANPVSGQTSLPTSSNTWLKAIQNTSGVDTATNLRKSDLIMTLSKIYKGVQQSSAIGFKDCSERDGTVWSMSSVSATVSPSGPFSYTLDEQHKSGKNYYGSASGSYDVLNHTFFEGTYGGGHFQGNQDMQYKLVPATVNYGVQFYGDYWLYYDPNVYEYYLSEAINDGIITINDVATTGMGAKFRSDYNDKSTGAWGSGNLLLDSSISSDCLGYSKTVYNSDTSFSVSSKKPTYFGSMETMTMMEALRLVESYMRANDENMSKSEAAIVRYKLGLNVLSYLGDDDQETITYLIATGVLDSDDSTIMGMLYDDATLENVYHILYRVANKSARTDFSKIQLTDSETFWASEGFAESKISIFKPETEIIHETSKITKISGNTRKELSVASNDVTRSKESTSILDRLLGVSSVNAAAKSDTIASYEIVKHFDTESVYRIGDTTISALVKASAADLKKYDITKITKTKITYAGKKHSVYEVHFTINATKKAAALAAVENRISVLSDLDKYKRSIAGVSQVTSNGTTINLISQASLKQAFSGIEVLEDKVLMNTSTGTLAYFSYDSNVTLVGTQVITGNYKGIVKAGDSIYYDLDAIMPLLSSAYLDTIGKQTSIVVNDVKELKTIAVSTSLMDSSDYFLNAQYLKVYTASQSGTDVDPDDMTQGFSCIATGDAKSSIKDTKDVNFFLKLNTLSSVSNKLTKSFSVSYNGTKISGTIIVDFNFAIPTTDSFSEWVQESVYDPDTLTYQEASQLLCTPPDKISEIKGLAKLAPKMSSVEKSALNAWWYSNYGMSNALCNYIYGTSKQVYVPSGYVAPSVTLLINNVEGETFLGWCKSVISNGSTGAANDIKVRDNILSQIFNKFALGDAYLKYNADTQNRFWHNFYKCDATGTPDYSDVGFSTKSKSVIATLAGTRKFNMLYEPTNTQSAMNALAKVASGQKIRTFGREYIVSESGSIYENVDCMGSEKQPMFTYTIKAKNGEDDSLAKLELKSRSRSSVSTYQGMQIVYRAYTLRYGGTQKSTTSKDSYYSIYPKEMFTSGGSLDASTVKLKMLRGANRKSAVTYKIEMQTADSKTEPLTGDAFIKSKYSLNYNTIFGDETTCPTDATLRNMVKSQTNNLLLDPSTLSKNVQLMHSVFGRKTVYIYTDKGANQFLDNAGQIYKWDGKTLTVCKSSAVLTEIYNSGAILYALPVYLVPRSGFFLDACATGTYLSGDIYNKSLNYLEYDLTSLNNQLIDAYMAEQSGVTNINKLSEKATVRIGDTVWVKDGEWWQSKPIKDSKNIKAAIINPKDMGWYSNKLFSGLYITVNGRQYSIQAYTSKMRMGSLVGTSEQFKSGIVYTNGDTVQCRKGNKTTAANSKTKAKYLSVKCKFSDELLVRPIDNTGTNYTILGHAGSGLISSANYPFFDEEASWDRNKDHSFNIATSEFKPSAAFLAAKKDFIAEFKKALAEDTWNYVWLVIMLLAAYLMIMSWFSYGVIGLGVGRAGFEAMMMRDRTGSHHGIDFIKVFTFGLYSIDRDVSFGRMVIISFACCIIIATILILIF